MDLLGIHLHDHQQHKKSDRHRTARIRHKNLSSLLITIMTHTLPDKTTHITPTKALAIYMMTTLNQNHRLMETSVIDKERPWTMAVVCHSGNKLMGMFQPNIQSHSPIIVLRSSLSLLCMRWRVMRLLCQTHNISKAMTNTVRGVLEQVPDLQRE